MPVTLGHLLRHPGESWRELQDLGWKRSFIILAPELIVLTAVVVGLILRILPSGRTVLHLDEVHKFDGATDYLAGLFSADIEHPAIGKHLIAISITFFGTSDLAVRFPNILLSSATVGLVYFIGKELGSPWGGVIAAWFLALMPFHIGYSYYAKEDPALSFALALTVLIYLRDRSLPARRRMNRTWFMCGICMATKLSAAVFPFIFLLHSQMTRTAPERFTSWKAVGKEFWRLVAFAALAFLIFSPWQFVHLPFFFLNGLNHWREEQVVGHQRYFMGESYSNTPIWFYAPLFAYLIPIILILVALTGVLLLFLRSEKDFRSISIIAVLWLGVPLLFYSAISFSSKHYAVIFMPPFALFCGLTVVRITALLPDLPLRMRALSMTGIPVLLVGLLLMTTIAAGPFYRGYHNGLYSEDEFEQIYRAQGEGAADLEALLAVAEIRDDGELVASDLSPFQLDHYLGTDYVEVRIHKEWIFTLSHREVPVRGLMPENVSIAQARNVTWVIVGAGTLVEGGEFMDFLREDARAHYVEGFEVHGNPAPFGEATRLIFRIDWT